MTTIHYSNSEAVKKDLERTALGASSNSSSTERGESKYSIGQLFVLLTQLGPQLAEFQQEMVDLEREFKKGANESAKAAAGAAIGGGIMNTVKAGTVGAVNVTGAGMQIHGLNEMKKANTPAGNSPMAALPGEILPQGNPGVPAGAIPSNEKHNLDLAKVAHDNELNARNGAHGRVVGQAAGRPDDGAAQRDVVDRENGLEERNKDLLAAHEGNVERSKHILDDAQKRFDRKVEEVHGEYVAPVEMTVRYMSEAPSLFANIPVAMTEVAKSQADNTTQTYNSEAGNVDGFRRKLGETVTEALSIAGRANDVRFGG